MAAGFFYLAPRQCTRCTFSLKIDYFPDVLKCYYIFIAIAYLILLFIVLA